MPALLGGFYDRFFAKLDQPDQSRYQRLEFSRHILAGRLPQDHASILDAGCGTGTNLVTLSQLLELKQPQLHGIDVSSEAVTRARLLGLSALCLDLNSEALPHPSGMFDAALLLEILEHLYYSDGLMRELRRVVKPGGVLVATTPNLGSWANRASILFGFQPPSLEVSFLRTFGQFREQTIPNGHIRAFTRRALRRYLLEFGFEKLEEGSTVAAGVSGIVRYVDEFFYHFPSFASHLVVAAIRS